MSWVLEFCLGLMGLLRIIRQEIGFVAQTFNKIAISIL